LTIALAVFITFSFMLIIFGPQLADALGHRFGLGVAFVWGWKILQWPIAFGLVVIGIGLVYYFAPDAEQEWVWITPGSLLATVLWLLASLVFRLYVVNFGNYQAVYGTVGAAIMLLTWLYLSGFVILIGAELNAEIEHASPWGKAAAEKAAGTRKKIGFAAARDYLKRRHWLRWRWHGAVPAPGAGGDQSPLPDD
jgi:membrane protein